MNYKYVPKLFLEKYGVCLKKRKHEAAISDLKTKLESDKKQSDTRLHQIEKRLADLERGTYLEDRSKIHGDGDYYYDSDY